MSGELERPAKLDISVVDDMGRNGYASQMGRIQYNIDGYSPKTGDL
jgi:hypothetical protein